MRFNFHRERIVFAVGRTYPTTGSGEWQTANRTTIKNACNFRASIP